MKEKNKQPQGTALIELALVLMVLVLLTFAVMEYGWMFFRMQQVINTARAGARHSVLPDSTNVEVQQIVQSMMTTWGMGASGYTATISSADITSLESGELVTVKIEVPYENIELLGMSLFPIPTNLRGSATMAKEGP
jgi:Flp pilus assembly protein TadG